MDFVVGPYPRGTSTPCMRKNQYVLYNRAIVVESVFSDIRVGLAGGKRDLGDTPAIVRYKIVCYEVRVCDVNYEIYIFFPKLTFIVISMCT